MVSAVNLLLGLVHTTGTTEVVEFCSGSGYVGLPVAALHPECSVTLVDMNVR
jgi:16S rRNA G1207 methylase RsmC